MVSSCATIPRNAFMPFPSSSIIVLDAIILQGCYIHVQPAFPNRHHPCLRCLCTRAAALPNSAKSVPLHTHSSCRAHYIPQPLSILSKYKMTPIPHLLATHRENAAAWSRGYRYRSRDKRAAGFGAEICLRLRKGWKRPQASCAAA
jgi:hypothetical protein